MGGTENGSVRRVTTIATLVAVSITALVQFAGLLIWGSRIDYRITVNEAGHLDMLKEIERINERGSRNFPLIEQRIKTLEAISAANTSRIELLTQHEVLHSREMERLIEQHKRIMEALEVSLNRTQQNSVKLGEIDGQIKAIFDYFKRTPPP